MHTSGVGLESFSIQNMRTSSSIADMRTCRHEDANRTTAAALRLLLVCEDQHQHCRHEDAKDYRSSLKAAAGL